MAPITQPAQQPTIFPEDLDGDGWMDMPIVRNDEFEGGMDEEDRRKYHYISPEKSKDPLSPGLARAGNATGNLIDFDGRGNEWRSKLEQDEGDYTRLRLNDDDDADEVHLRTRYLFDEDKAMTPLSQMQATKNLLTEAQRIAYVGVCALACREMILTLRRVGSKELTPAITSMELWSLKIMGRVYYHMEVATAEQKMIESLSEHGVQATDLVPALMTTHTVANPEYDPAEARLVAQKQKEEEKLRGTINSAASEPPPIATSTHPNHTPKRDSVHHQTTANVLGSSSTPHIQGVTTSLSSTDENVTLDIRWTVLCDLFLILIADSVYDSRSRVLLETVALKLGLGWLDVVKFEKRVTDALEIQEGAETLENDHVIQGRIKAAKKKRYVMMGLATLGGGLVIGLSAGLLAPVIGAGLGAAFTTIGITGTGTFLAGAGGAAVITTGGVLTGSSIAGKGMARRTQQVRIFNLLPLHNNKRVNCIVTVPGFMAGPQDDVRLPFSVLDPIVGDVFSVLWEPEMMGEMGNALRILTSEVLSQVGQTVLQATVMTALMSALQWPLILTKLGYLIDNPWSNALDRSYAAGLVLADVLLQRSLGVRPISLIGFSLGARTIFYALLELAKHKAMGIVQDVFLLGATLTAPKRSWLQARSVVAGRFVNGFARNDWVLNYLFRATSGGLNTVAGLRPVEDVPGLENVDVTDKIAGHTSYRTFMPLILDQLGFPVSADYFDEPEELEMEEDRIVIREQEIKPAKKPRFSFFSRKSKILSEQAVTPATSASIANSGSPPPSSHVAEEDELPQWVEHINPIIPPASPTRADEGVFPALPAHAGFDFEAIKSVIGKKDLGSESMEIPVEHNPLVYPTELPQTRSRSAPIPDQHASSPTTPTFHARLSFQQEPSSTKENHSNSDILPHELARAVSTDDSPIANSIDSLVGEDGLQSYEYSGPLYGSPPAPMTSSGRDGTVWNPDVGLRSVLSFGGADSSISLPPISDDPWAPMRSESKSGAGALNPWNS